MTFHLVYYLTYEFKNFRFFFPILQLSLDFSTNNLGSMSVVMDGLMTAKHPDPDSHTERWSTYP